MRRILTVLSLLGMLATSASAGEGLAPVTPQCGDSACACTSHGGSERLSIVPSNCQVPGCRGCGLGSHCSHCGGLFGSLTGCNGVDGCHGGCLNTCNMPPHYAYYPADHGSYYFRPYNYHNISRHQQFVMGWGGDPRHPYANTVFERVYASLGYEPSEEVLRGAREPGPVADPFSNEQEGPPAPPSLSEPLQAPVPPPAPPTPSLDQDTRVKPATQDMSLARFVKVPAPRKAEQDAAVQSAIRVQFITPVE